MSSLNRFDGLRLMAWTMAILFTVGAWFLVVYLAWRAI